MNAGLQGKRHFMLSIVMVLTLLALAMPVGAQEGMMGPAVEVSDQVVYDSSVIIDYIYSDGPGFIVIHIDNGQGAPGPVIGYRMLSPGENYNVLVDINAALATPTLFAMLHVDTGEVGVYEFGSVQGADGPVRVNDMVITPPFNVAVLNVYDQFIENDTYVAASVTVAEAGFLVIHAANDEGNFGPVIGYTAIEAGTTADVAVSLDPAGITDVLWPMLHVDTGEAGVYEFGTVQGVDGPVVINGVIATTAVHTFPDMIVHDQIVMRGDSMDMGDTAPTVMAFSVLSEGPGWLVIHQGTDSGPGPVAGYAPVEAGLNLNVVVELNPAMVTPELWPMLHVDTGEAGVYEFGSVQGADGPVRVNDQVLTFPIFAAPSILYEVEQVDESTLYVPQALIDAPGWLVIHVDAGDGTPGPVAGYAPLTPGLNVDIYIPVNGDMVTATVFPMLHYDTGEAGVYEFGSVQGADTPVRVGGSVIVGPAEVVMGE